MPASDRTLIPAFNPDEMQKQAIEHVHGPMLVIAGAGTGKTTVLTRRIAHLVNEGHARPDEILALTYTENAAAEMADRAALELGKSKLKGLQATTFHAYCFGLLKRADRGFAVLDDQDLWIYVRRRIHELHLQHFVRAANVSQFLKALNDFMRHCQDELVPATRYRRYVEQLERGEVNPPRVSKSKDADKFTAEEALDRCREIARVYEIVERWLAEDNLGTFGHMITRAHDLLQADSNLRTAEQTAARFILVDEFQDANYAQIKILALLAGVAANIFGVGDPDQAIYRFRGASAAAFGMFFQQFSQSKVVRLERNRRSLSPILRCAHALIAENPEIATATGAAVRQPLIAAREENIAPNGLAPESRPVEIALGGITTDEAKSREAMDIASSILQRKRQQGGKWADFAVLYRSHRNRDETVRELAANDIPFFIDGLDVLDTSDVRYLLACAGAVVEMTDSISLFRVATLPAFGISPEALRTRMSGAERNTPLALLLSKVAGGAAVLAHVARVRSEISGKKSLAALRTIANRFRLNPESPAIAALLDFVQTWQEKPITTTGNLNELLEYLKYFREAEGVVLLKSEPGRDAVQLMTAHAAKGLEFEDVFILRVNSSSFPAPYREPLFELPQELRDSSSVVPLEGKELANQEGRRLLYVAMTRARDRLTMYAKAGWGKDPTPPGYLRSLLKNRALGASLRSREAQALQARLYEIAAEAESVSPVTEWLKLPPSRDLHLHLSATAIQKYKTCPLQFKLNRDWRIPEEARAALQYGSSMHLALRHYYDGVRYGKQVTADEVVQIFRDEFAKAAIEEDYQRALYEKQGALQLTEFVRLAEAGARPEVLHTEESFSVQIGPSTIRGRIDRIDRLEGNRVRIVDYKTGKAQSEENADKSLQLSIYAIAAQELWGYTAERLVFHNLEDNSTAETVRNVVDMDATRLVVEEVAQQIAEGKFEPVPGSHCAWCGYRSLCPATEKTLPLPKPAKRGG